MSRICVHTSELTKGIHSADLITAQFSKQEVSLENGINYQNKIFSFVRFNSIIQSFDIKRYV